MSDITFSIEAIVDDAVNNVKNFGASMNQTANNGVNNFRQLNRAFGLLNKGVQEVEAAFKFARDEAEKLGRTDVSTNIDRAKDSFAGLADILVQVPVGGRDFLQWMGDAAAGATNLAHLVGALAIQFELTTGQIDQAQAKLQLDSMLTDENANKKKELAAATKSVSDKLAESDSAYINAAASAEALKGAQDRVKAGEDAVSKAADDMAKWTQAAADASDALKSSQDSWTSSTAGQAEAALKAAGASSAEYAAGIRAIDDAMGSNLTVTANQQADIDALTEKYVSGKISIEAYNSGLEDIEAVYMPKAAGALDLGNEAMIEFATTTGKVNTRLGVETPAAFLTGSGAATQFGIELKKQTSLDSGLYVYGVGIQSLTANINALSAAIRNVPELALPNSGPYGGAPLTGKAGGGPVSAGATYLVGEKGPELFTPNSSGTITPNGQTMAGGNLNIYLGNTLVYSAVMAEARARGDGTVQVD